MSSDPFLPPAPDEGNRQSGNLPYRPGLRWTSDDGRLEVSQIGENGERQILFTGVPGEDGLYRTEDGLVVGRRVGVAGFSEDIEGLATLSAMADAKHDAEIGRTYLSPKAKARIDAAIAAAQDRVHVGKHRVATRSVNLAVGAFQQGERSPLVRRTFERALRVLVPRKKDRFWLLADLSKVHIFGEGGGVCEIDIGDQTKDDLLWWRLLDMLQKTSNILCWDGGAIVGNEATIAELSPAMKKNLGEIKVCGTVDEMKEFIRTHSSYSRKPRPPA